MTSSTTNNKKINADNAIDVDIFRKNILKWYKGHQRALPWRIPYGSKTKPDPYHVWLSEIMLQQTTVPTVIPYFEKFLNLWPTVHDLANAEQDEVLKEWAGLGYYARARNLHKCAKSVVSEYKGKFPKDQKALESLSGIGSYTSAAIRSIAFGKPANVVDGNIERVMARVFAVTDPMPASKPYLKELAGLFSHDRADAPGHYAQALMDIGTSICTDSPPKCLLCPVRGQCEAHKQGIAAELPKRVKKAKKPHKHGEVYLIHDLSTKSLLFLKRGEKGMLGGMTGLPTSNWDISKNDVKAPTTIHKHPLKHTDLLVKHSFTHFDLMLQIKEAKLKDGTILPENDHFWVKYCDIEDLGLPTLFKKVIKLLKF